jgi:hypothetical protein
MNSDRLNVQRKNDPAPQKINSNRAAAGFRFSEHCGFSPTPSDPCPYSRLFHSIPLIKTVKIRVSKNAGKCPKMRRASKKKETRKKPGTTQRRGGAKGRRDF